MGEQSWGQSVGWNMLTIPQVSMLIAWGVRFEAFSLLSSGQTFFGLFALVAAMVCMIACCVLAVWGASGAFFCSLELRRSGNDPMRAQLGFFAVAVYALMLSGAIVLYSSD